MIVRISEFDISRAEAAAEWGPDPHRGLIRYNWPADAHAFEVIVLDRDEQARPLTEDFRRGQVRQLITETITALREPGEEFVLRLDGVLAENELLPALRHVTDADWVGRYVLSETGRLEPEPREVIASLRINCSPAAAALLLGDASLGLDRSVRLRAFGVPRQWVHPLLQLGLVDEEGWQDAMAIAGFQVGTVRGLRSLQVLTPRLDAGAFKTRLMRRLLAAAGKQPADTDLNRR